MKHVSFGDHGYFELPKGAGAVTGMVTMGSTLYVMTADTVYQVKWPAPWYKKIVARIRGFIHRYA